MQDHFSGKRKINKQIYAAAGIVLLLIIAAAVVFIRSPDYEPKGYTFHAIGPENATIEILEFSDFQCKFCKAAAPIVKSVVNSYDNVKLVYRHFPLPYHEFAQKAAEASECAADQDKFWEYHDKLFENQNSLYIPELKRYAGEIGLNMSAFNACLDSGVMSSRVQNDIDKGKSLGVSSTPMFFINGEKLAGSQPFNEFRRVIDRISGD